MRKELKYNPLDLQGLEISNAVVNTFPTKTDAQNYFTLKSFGVEQKGMQVIFLDTLKTAKWDGTQFIEVEIVETFTDTTEGVVPASGGGTTNFLRADGTWATPAGGGGLQNVFIQESEPTEITPFIWFKTNENGKIIDIRQNI